ncbi:MAG: hypothetical protein ACRYHA_30520, partial [Janthinobacterium lividum]
MKGPCPVAVRVGTSDRIYAVEASGNAIVVFIRVYPIAAMRTMRREGAAPRSMRCDAKRSEAIRSDVRRHEATRTVRMVASPPSHPR